jgi:glycosyltransferase involved in cell wall biosynthesis
MMKVLHVINTLSAGGAELHLLTLCRHLKRQGVEVCVAFLRERVKGSESLRNEFQQTGIRVVDLGSDRRFDPGCIFKLVNLIRRERPDIVHSHLPRADFAAAIAHWFYPSISFVCSVHDIYSKSWSGKWALTLFNFIWRRAYAVIAISQAVKDWLVHERGIPSGRVCVIHYGIDAERFAYSGSDLRKTRDLTGRAVIGSVGRLEPRKGHEYLIQAMPSILEEVPSAHLLIAGHDPSGHGRKLRTLIAHLGLNERVRLVGFQDDVSSFLQSLDLFAFASTSEGFGQVVIEAMAAGKPVVATNVSALREIVIDRETGLLASPRDPQGLVGPICRLLKDADLRRKMGRAGRKRVEETFNAERMVEGTIKLYAGLSGGR